MPMAINFSEPALRTLMAPPPPAQPLSDIILTIKVSRDLNALAMMGRDMLRCCVRSRKYRPPIESQFEIDVDEQISDRDLARVARESLLLQRLKVDEVASDPTDIAHIFCAYVGATFMCSFKEGGSNKIHDSINDLCAMVLDDDAREVTDVDSHERMLNIPGLERLSTPIKQETAPSYSSSTRAPSTVSQMFEHRTIESVSSGRSPPPLSYGAHYQQSFQPYYLPPNATIAPPHMQPMHNPALHPRYSPFAGIGPVLTSHPASIAHPQPQQYNTPPPQTIPSQPGYLAQPPGAIPPGGYPGMGISQNQGFPPPPPPAPMAAPQQSQGFISLVNELAMKHRKAITWQQAKVGQQHMPEWTMWLSVDGEIRGHGTAATKQAAKELASQNALQSLGWMHS